MPLIDERYMQYGFAGICLILLGILVWMIRSQNGINQKNTDALIDVIQKNNSALAKVIDAVKSVERTEVETQKAVETSQRDITKSVDNLTQEVAGFKEKFLSRPCITRGHQ